MTRRRTGILLMALGGLLVILSVVIKLNTSDDSQPAAVETTTTISATSVTTGGPTVNPSDPERPTTTSTSQVTTTVLATTTTTTSATEQVAKFISLFAEALVSGDTTFVNSRLHPEIVSGFGVEACASWVASQIMSLSEYRLTGDIVGPTIGSLTTPSGSLQFPNRYSAQVSFTFGGQSFESTADFVVLDGTVYFTGACQ